MSDLIIFFQLKKISNVLFWLYLKNICKNFFHFKFHKLEIFEIYNDSTLSFLLEIVNNTSDFLVRDYTCAILTIQIQITRVPFPTGDKQRSCGACSFEHRISTCLC